MEALLGWVENSMVVLSRSYDYGVRAKNPALTIDKLGRVYVVWAENRNGPVDNIFFARDE